MSFIDGLSEAPIVPRKEPQTEVVPVLDSIKEDILRQVSSVVSGVTRFADISEHDEGPPEEWVEQLGEEEATRVFRVARLANLPKKDAPAGMEYSVKLLTGIMAAESRKKAPRRTMNVSLVGMPAPELNYASIQDEGE
jgi:hypothetical protein